MITKRLQVLLCALYFLHTLREGSTFAPQFNKVGCRTCYKKSKNLMYEKATNFRIVFTKLYIGFTR